MCAQNRSFASAWVASWPFPAGSGPRGTQGRLTRIGPVERPSKPPLPGLLDKAAPFCPWPFRRPRLGGLVASGGGTPRRADRLSSLTRQGVLVTLVAWRRPVREPEGRRADRGHDRDDHGLVPLCHLLAAPQPRLRGPGPHRGPGRGLGARLRGGSSA